MSIPTSMVVVTLKRSTSSTDGTRGSSSNDTVTPRKSSLALGLVVRLGGELFAMQPQRLAELDCFHAPLGILTRSEFQITSQPGFQAGVSGNSESVVLQGGGWVMGAAGQSRGPSAWPGPVSWSFFADVMPGLASSATGAQTNSTTVRLIACSSVALRSATKACVRTTVGKRRERAKGEPGVVRAHDRRR